MQPPTPLARASAIIAALLLSAASPSAQIAPLHLTTVEGGKLTLGGGERKVVVVHYWATWCAPCRIEMPMLDAAYRRYHGAGLDMVGIALDAGASRPKIRQAGGVSFPLARLSDSSLNPSQVPGALPETLIYGRDGRLRHAFRAGKEKFDAATLERILPPLLAER